LQLLDERSREVDAMVQQADERARRVTAEAEQRAQEITAAAERQRTELEEQVATLRSEIAAMREELANLKAPSPNPPPRDTRGPSEPFPPVATNGSHDSMEADNGGEEPEASDGATVESPAIVQPDLLGEDDTHSSEAGVAPRWGRRSSMAAAQQAVRTRSARPRWLPPWIPFLLLLLVAASVLAANVGGQTVLQSGATATPPDVTTLAPPPKQ
jgi:hypothetical protein